MFLLHQICKFTYSICSFQSQAEERGLTKRDGSYLLATIGIANTFGRIVLGYISDKDWVNRLWVYNFCLAACGISKLFLFTLVKLPD